MHEISLTFCDKNVGDAVSVVGSYFNRLNKNSQSITYLGYYEIQNDFDFSQLDGQITFDRGRLVERNKIYFR